MNVRPYSPSAGPARGASDRRRIRRATRSRRPYCTTNGCTTYLVPDVSGQVAECPVCGARRAIH
ncbi:MAG: hypothetical protein M3N29_07890 [Chloroflexota bacterium]|nr:hypothetical protein [Chloroflexota bacterium]